MTGCRGCWPVRRDQGDVRQLDARRQRSRGGGWRSGGSGRDRSGPVFPGATFEIVTTAAALDTGRYTPSSLIVGRSPLTVSGVSIRNDLNQSFGQISLTRALGYSVNTVFAQVGAAVGPRQMTAYMRRLGFYSSPQLGSTSERVSTSGMRLAGRFVLPGAIGTSLGRLAIGQGGVTVTPLQMAMVASAVADHGTLVTPRLRTRSCSPTVSLEAAAVPVARRLGVSRGERELIARPDPEAPGG